MKKGTKPKEWTKEKAIKDYPKWLKEMYDWNIVRQRPLVDHDISESDFIGVAVSAGIIANWVGMDGALRLLQGDASGWEGVLLSCDHTELDQQILVRWPTSKQEPIPLSFCLLHAIASGARDRTTWCGTKLLETRQFEKESVHYRWLEEQHLIPFAATLYACLADVSWEIAELDLGPYRSVFDKWDDPYGLSTAMAGVCDYHCLRSPYCSSGFPEFDFGPWGAYPVEIIAIREIRDVLGLETILPEHHLLDTNFMKGPPKGRVVHDELLERIRTAVNKSLPPEPPLPPFEWPTSDEMQTRIRDIFRRRVEATPTPPRRPSKKVGKITYDVVLINGSEEELHEYAYDEEYSIVVDWRDDPAQTVDSVAKCLPSESLFAEGVDEDHLLIQYNDSEHTYLVDENHCRTVICELNRILAKAYEIRAFKISLGSDTPCYYAKPCAWWGAMEKKFPERMLAVFEVVK